MGNESESPFPPSKTIPMVVSDRYCLSAARQLTLVWLQFATVSYRWLSSQAELANQLTLTLTVNR